MTSIDLNAYKERQMKRRLESLINKKGFKDFQEYVNGLKKDDNLLKEFLSYMTINVSEFYRNPSQWEILEKEVIPYLIDRNKRDLKIWSAACSTGQEPYSLVMLLNKFYPFSRMSIIATDIDDEILKKARVGQYDEKEIKGIPKEYVGNYIHKKGDVYAVSDEVKRCVQFKHHNLLKDTYPSQCDLIICRNVLIYFTEEAKDGIYKNFNKALSEGSILFVGSTEQIINANKYNFKPLRTFFYKKEGNIE